MCHENTSTPITSSWYHCQNAHALRAAQELTAGGALLGSHEALTMHHFKEIETQSLLFSAHKELTSGIGPERKLLLRVVVHGPHLKP